MLHTLVAQRFQSRQELLMGCSAEIANADITYLWTDHIDGIYRFYGDFIACNGKCKTVFDALADNAQFYFRALRTTQAFHNLLFRHLYASDSRIVYRYDSVASDDTNLF